MSETAQQLCTPLDPQIPERAESNSALGDEACLTVEILQYWDAHLHYQGSMKETNQKAQEVRQHLGKLLFHLKQVLAKPGRLGQWSSFLKEHSISRATADRLVQKHERSLSPDGNRLAESIPEPTEEQIQTILNKVAPKLRRVLRTPASAYRFVDLLSGSFEGLERRVTEEGFVVLRPAQHTAAVESVPAESQVEAAPLIADTVVEANSILCEP